MNPVLDLLDEPAVFGLLVRLSLGAVASFLAILSWTRARSLAWIFVVFGVLAGYAGILYSALRLFGLFSGPEILIFGISLGVLISENVPVLFFILGFVFFLRNDR